MIRIRGRLAGSIGWGALVAAFLVCFPAMAQQAGQTPVFAPGTVIAVDGSYIVTRNIVNAGCAAPSVISIAVPAGAGRVDLNLNGFTLDNSGCAGDVISVTTPGHEVTVRNGTLVGGVSSINVPISGFGSLLKIRIDDIKSLGATGAAIHLSDVPSGVIRNSQLTGTIPGAPGSGGGAAILWDGVGAVAGGTIENNVIRGYSAGIALTVSALSVAVLHNRIEGILATVGCPGPPPLPTGTGIFVAGGGSVLISENNVVDICSEGIRTSSCKGCKLYDNTVRSCAFHGIHLDPATTGTLLLNNVSNGNGFGGGFPSAGDGILVEGDNNALERNVVTANTRCGIHLAGAASIPANPGLSCGNAYGRNLTIANGGIGCAPCAATAPAALVPDFCNANAAPACVPLNASYTDNLKPGTALY